MTFRSNGGNIDPTTHKGGSQMQFMSCPGPGERQGLTHVHVRAQFEQLQDTSRI